MTLDDKNYQAEISIPVHARHAYYERSPLVETDFLKESNSARKEPLKMHKLDELRIRPPRSILIADCERNECSVLEGLELVTSESTSRILSQNGLQVDVRYAAPIGARWVIGTRK